ncbi:TetR/AcrR family transcriptional regulator [Nocardioides sp. W7]|uniref:TetR/AcrR family transcriptional regulator n=1 Tax=Nocardioides sp. W7 TaxID=2931390 RepID=UPI001FD058EB|nr:TetR/AcrR family transcriptional regulator [Nocardioides sp. W7]
MVDERTDGRRARGDATRRRVALDAAMMATVGGLDAITLGSLAERTGVSKSGILTVFGSREAVQVAAVGQARRIYVDAVVRPAWGREPGAERLRGLVEAWREYVRAEVFPGGCFLAATSVEYGRRAGPVAEAVRGLKREWLDLLEAELTTAGSRRPADDAFRLDAYLDAGNARHQLWGSPEHLEEVDRACRLAFEVIPAHA